MNEWTNETRDGCGRDTSTLLKPEISKVDEIAAKIEESFKEEGITLEEMFETLREVRKELVQELYGDVEKPSDDQG